ncbi:PREDICTED: uncharacterized protein LOC106808551 [Priapulus caudatus]|uniref:Uncharacterized protein LOC106808551 n=1 Tax=Priapulus caudatus TaxID=37621 RepID=A0ABM1E3M7_PRICU|nr:PREDICTED: uncharacterized protein LOC106808551 [Priapulus caudatus]
MHSLVDAERCNKTIWANKFTETLSSPVVTEANKGRPLYCFYDFLIHPNDEGDIIGLEVTSMDVGTYTDSGKCENGFMQIIDGVYDARQNNRQHPGYFCGNPQRPHFFYSETKSIRLVFSTPKYDHNVLLQLRYRTYTKKDASVRFGKFGVGDRGRHVDATYCDMEFINCDSARNCLVLSPGFPGIYPRNLTCRYHLMWDGMDNQVRISNQALFVVGGPPCDDPYFCDTTAVLTRDDCDGRDHVRFYDGETTAATVIGTFCGKGQVPDVVSSGKHMVVEFASTRDGRFLDNGFQFRSHFVPNFYRVPSSRIVNAKCDWIFYGSMISSGQLNSVDHWYPPGTVCTFRFAGLPNQRVLLYFTSFDTVYNDSCATNITLYDAQRADRYKLEAVFCGHSRPKLCPQETQLGEKKGCGRDQRYVSSGSDYLLAFYGTRGSLTGDEFEYKIMYEFINTTVTHFASAMPGPVAEGSLSADDTAGSCNVHYDSWGAATRRRGNFSSPTNPLFYGPGGNTRLRCKYTFRGLSFERLKITLHELHLRNYRGCDRTAEGRCLSLQGRDADVNTLTIVDGSHSNTVCLCNSGSELYPVGYTSLTHTVDVFFEIANITVRDDSRTFNFSATYEFVVFDCGGQASFRGRQGLLFSPNVTSSLRCRWTISVSAGRFVYLRFLDFYFQGRCETNRLRFYEYNASVPYAEVCAGNFQPEIFSKGWDEHEMASTPTTSHRVIVEMVADDPAGRFHILWSEVSRKVTRQRKDDILRVTNQDCDFECPDGRTCIARELVCNGIRNCPDARATSEHSMVEERKSLELFLDDESGGDCDSDQSLLYLLLGAVSAVAVLFIVVVTYCIYRCCNYERKEPRYLYR